MTIKAPFPWFGGKSRVTDVVWKHFGDVGHYVEPFAGSLAVLLSRPNADKLRATQLETITDKDGFVANFWRAVKHDPEGVAEWATHPINETDLIATHLWLVQHTPELLPKLEADPFYYDSRIAGLWVWGQSCWVGAGWCLGQGPWSLHEGSVVDTRKVEVPEGTLGVRRKIPNLISSGVGVNRPHLDVQAYMKQISDRLKYVRVAAGDWKRILTTGVLYRGKPRGIFLDPPYREEVRYKGLYSTDTTATLNDEVMAWAIEHGADPDNRIALCGYEGEYEMPSNWKVHAHSSTRAYPSSKDKSDGNVNNRHKERIWFSPHCVEELAF